MSVKIIVDSSTDLPFSIKDRIRIVPLPVRFGDEEFLDGVTIDYVKFYEKLITSPVLPSTSQPNPAAFTDAYREVVKQGDEAVVITISSKLSGTWQSAMIGASDFEHIYVVDSQNGAIGAGVLAELAVQYLDAGMSAKEIAEKLEVEKEKVRLVAMIDTLEFLKRSGRISKTVAFAGGILSIKPIIEAHDGVISMVGKARGVKNGFKQIGAEAEKQGEIDFSRPIILGFTGGTPECLDKYEEIYGTFWKREGASYQKTAVGSAIGTHIGPGAVAVAFFIK